jgi:hypothetical protein
MDGGSACLRHLRRVLRPQHRLDRADRPRRCSAHGLHAFSCQRLGNGAHGLARCPFGHDAFGDLGRRLARASQPVTASALGGQGIPGSAG